MTKISRIVRRDPVGDADAAAGVLTLTFDANASKISKVSKSLLAEYRNALSNALHIVVMGHATNDGGTIDSPWARRVSMLRARKVSDYLVSTGTPRSKVSTFWYANRLTVSKVSERANRRVVLVWVEE